MALRAAVFDLDGVLALPSVAGSLSRTEEALALPRGFLGQAIQQEGVDSLGARLMRGEIMFSQWAPLMEEDCRKRSQASGVHLPENFSIREIFGKAVSARNINQPMLQAARALKQNGFITCILTNNWLDDSPHRGILAQLMCKLNPHFDFLIESCQTGLLKPEPQIYKFLLDTLKASPSEVVFLDDFGSNLKPARELGMSTILVRDTDTALKELEKVIGTQNLGWSHPLAVEKNATVSTENRTVGVTALALWDMYAEVDLWDYMLIFPETPRPISCSPNDVSHGYVTVKPGVRLHFVEMGSGPAVILCHGFPETWFSWRYQIPAIAQAGFRVIAMDMKGYGESSSPPEIEEYAMEVLCKEMLTFLDKMGIPQAVFIGHDWAGVVVWNMAFHYPERVRAVASLNTPYKPANPKVSDLEIIKTLQNFDYQIYFQEPGVAEAELEQNLSRSFKSLFRSHDEGFLKMYKVTEMGGLFVNAPEDPSLSKMLTEEDIEFYVQQFKKTGFRGPLNWYRNIQRNWEWYCKGMGRKILIPALMVTAENDVVLRPKLSENMETWIPNLKRAHIKECGHWTQMEKPAEVNQILLQWLESEFKNPTVVSKM